MRARLDLTGITCHNPEDRVEADLFYLAGGAVVDQSTFPVVLSPMGMRRGQFRLPWPDQSAVFDTETRQGAEISFGVKAFDRDLASQWGKYEQWLEQLAFALTGVNVALGGDPRNADIIDKVKKVVNTLVAVDGDDDLGSHTASMQVANAPVQEFEASFRGESATGTWNYSVYYRLALPDLVPAGQVARIGGSVQMMHHLSTRLLHSHGSSYVHEGGSGQQQVTAYDGVDGNNWWTFRAGHGQPDAPGQPIEHGQVIRLQHVGTGRNLHSHPGFPSPVSGQQEVTCYGDGGHGDGNDNWRVEVEGGGVVESPKLFRLVHELTGVALHSHYGQSSRDLHDQQEVTGFPGRDGNDLWRIFQIA